MQNLNQILSCWVKDANQSHLFICHSFLSRLLACIGVKRTSKLDLGLPSEEEDSNLSEYTEVRKQLDKTKKRIKTLVNVIDAQNTLLRRLARKIDPGDEIDARSLDDIRPTVEENQATMATDYLDGEVPEKKISDKTHEVTVC